MDQQHIAPTLMQQDTISHQIRQIKRRRIEIRSARAALDMEEIDLDGRLTFLENSIGRSTKDEGVDVSKGVEVGRVQLVSTGDGHDGDRVALFNHVEETLRDKDAETDQDANWGEDGDQGLVVQQSLRPNGHENKKKRYRHTTNNVGLEMLRVKEGEGKNTKTSISKLRRYESETHKPTKSAMIVDDDDDDDANGAGQLNHQVENNDAIMFTRKRKRRNAIPAAPIPDQASTSNMVLDSECPPAMFFADPDRKSTSETSQHSATMKPTTTNNLSKIVPLNVHFDPEERQQTIAASRRRDIIEANKALLKSPISNYSQPAPVVRRKRASLLPRPKNRRRGDKGEKSPDFQKNLRQTPSDLMTSRATAHQSATQIQTRRVPRFESESQSLPKLRDRFQSRPNSTSPSSCPCQGRNRNCHTCNGTPAVIAENRIIPSPSSSHEPLSQVRTRMVHRPETYHIPEFEDMTPKSRADLEMRLCRRILESLGKLVDDQTRGVDRGNGDIRMRDLVVGEGKSTTLLGELAKLVEKRAVARLDDQGNWIGSRLVSRCADMIEFEAAVQKVVGDMTEVHPKSCCGNADDGVFGRSCWGITFLSCFQDMLERCHECMEACSVCVNDEERKNCVDEWSLM